MDVKELKRLMDAMRVTGVAELELEWDGSEERPGGRVLLRREAPSNAPAANGAGTPPGALAAAAPAASPAASPAVAAPDTTLPAESSPQHVEVLAPLVGTFYAASSPDTEAFARVGDRVKVGQVLCIIEAMKLMNEIEAEVAGTVVEVLVRNQDPVEYGQVLMRIAPA